MTHILLDTCYKDLMRVKFFSNDSVILIKLNDHQHKLEETTHLKNQAEMTHL